MKCRICGNNQNNAIYEAREMMMGLRETFLYFQCGKCKCLQIAEIPDDIGRYYTDDYYSFREQDSSGFFMRQLKKIRNKYAVFGRPYMGKLLYERYPELNLRSLSYLGIRKDMRVLDIGCGTGDLLRALDELGI